MNNSVKYFSIIAVVLSLVGYTFLFIQGQRLNSENQEKKAAIAKNSAHIKKLRAEIELEEEKLDSLRQVTEEQAKTQDEFIDLIANSNDQATFTKGKQIVEKKGIETGKFFIKKSKEERSYNDALKYEKKGFDALLRKDVDAALEAFIRSENSYNSFHQVYEIAQYLRANKEQLSQGSDRAWQAAYARIVNDFNWKMPSEAKQNLKRELEQSTN
ncbi:MAG: hypothetical protein Crog4KO_20940 [Crocinitomicaceae bacterium]